MNNVGPNYSLPTCDEGRRWHTINAREPGGLIVNLVCSNGAWRKANSGSILDIYRGRNPPYVPKPKTTFDMQSTPSKNWVMYESLVDNPNMATTATAVGASIGGQLAKHHVRDSEHDTLSKEINAISEQYSASSVDEQSTTEKTKEKTVETRCEHVNVHYVRGNWRDSVCKNDLLANPELQCQYDKVNKKFNVSLITKDNKSCHYNEGVPISEKKTYYNSNGRLLELPSSAT